MCKLIQVACIIISGWAQNDIVDPISICPVPNNPDDMARASLYQGHGYKEDDPGVSMPTVSYQGLGRSYIILTATSAKYLLTA